MGYFNIFIIPILVDTDKNPILGNNESSGIVVTYGKKFRMFTMPGKINLHLHR
jgi:glutathionyl-hydroquinone reductase